MFLVSFNPQTLLISVVVVVIFICGLVFVSFCLTGNRQKKGHQEIATFLTELEKNLQLNKQLVNEQKVFPIKVFAPEIDKYLLQRTELPKNNLNNSLVLIESFIDSQKRNELVVTSDATLTIFDQNLILKGSNFELIIDLSQLFYVAGFYDLKSKTLLFSLVDYQQNRSFKFQFLYFEDLAAFNKLVYQFKIENEKNNH